VFEGQGKVNYYVGGYAEWAKRGGSFSENPGTMDNMPGKTERKPKPQKQQTDRAGKLSYMVQRELDALPEKIETAEAELAELQSIISDPEFYENDQTTIEITMKKVATAQENLEALYARWEEIEQSKQQ